VFRAIAKISVERNPVSLYKLVHGRDIHHKSNDRILEELHLLKNFGFNSISPLDDLFAAKRSHF
jgi:hypothetical protein